MALAELVGLDLGTRRFPTASGTRSSTRLPVGARARRAGPGLRARPQGAPDFCLAARPVGGRCSLRRRRLRAREFTARFAATAPAPGAAAVGRAGGRRPDRRGVGQGPFGGIGHRRRIGLLHRDVLDLPARTGRLGRRSRSARTGGQAGADDRPWATVISRPGRPGGAVPVDRRSAPDPHRPGSRAGGGIPPPDPARPVHDGDECALGRGRRGCGTLGVDVGLGSVLSADVPRGWSACACRRGPGRRSRLHCRVRRVRSPDSGAGHVRMTLRLTSRAGGPALTRAGGGNSLGLSKRLVRWWSWWACARRSRRWRDAPRPVTPPPTTAARRQPLTNPVRVPRRTAVVSFSTAAPARCSTHFPADACRRCGDASHLEWREVSGAGRVYTFTVVHRAAVPGFTPPMPSPRSIWMQGPRVFGGVLDCPPDGVRIGMPVRVVLEQRAGFGAMPNFSAQTR